MFSPRNNINTMLNQIHIFLISTLLLLGAYEIIQLTKLGSKYVTLISFLTRWYYTLILTKKAMRNIYKYQHQ